MPADESNKSFAVLGSVPSGKFPMNSDALIVGLLHLMLKKMHLRFCRHRTTNAPRCKSIYLKTNVSLKSQKSGVGICHASQATRIDRNYSSHCVSFFLILRKNRCERGIH